MVQRIAQFAVTVRDYDEALAFYVGKLGFERLEDSDLGNGKRWVRVRPVGSEAGILLARAVSESQVAIVGNQTGGRVFVFLETDDFWRDYRRLVERGVHFVRPPAEEPFGTVAVFEDLYGNRFDLIERRPSVLPASAPPRGSTPATRLSTDPNERAAILTYREMTIADHENALQLWSRSEGIGLAKADEKAGVARFLERNRGLSFVCVDRARERLAGTILCGHDGRRGLLHHIAVDVEYRGQSIGRWLVRLGMDGLKSQDIERCLVVVKADNHAGRRFWARIGWTDRHDRNLFSRDT